MTKGDAGKSTLHESVDSAFARSRTRLGVGALVLAAALIAVALGFAAFQPQSRQPAPPAQFAINAGTSGMIDGILVKPGDLVRKGQLVATCDTSHQRAVLDAAE